MSIIELFVCVCVEKGKQNEQEGGKKISKENLNAFYRWFMILYVIPDASNNCIHFVRIARKNVSHYDVITVKMRACVRLAEPFVLHVCNHICQIWFAVNVFVLDSGRVW